MTTIFLSGSLSHARAEDVPASATLAEPVSAQPEPAPSGYQEAVDLAVEEFAHANYLEARARFAEAHRLWPNARSLRALGYCEYELKNYVASRELLAAALASTVRPLSDTQRQEAEQLLARAEGYVGHYVIRTLPPDAQLAIDGVDAVLDPQRSIALRVGEHTLEVRAAGYRTARRVLAVEGRASCSIVVELQAEAAPSLTSQPEQAPHEQPLRKKWWLWTGVAGVVVAGVTAGLVAALRDPGTRDASGGNADLVIVIPSAGGQP